MGTFADIEIERTETRVLAIKKYVRSCGTLIQRHYQRELWALRFLGFKKEAEASEHHIVFLITAYSKHSLHCLVFPYYEYTLQNYTAERDRQLALYALYQIAQGLQYMHSEGIIHCDICPSNILVDSNDHMVICDFGCAHFNGLSTANNDNDDDEIGTRFYKAPEHMFGHRMYQPSTDIWSLGALFAELLIGEPICPGKNDLEQIGFIVKRLGTPSWDVLHNEMSRYPDTNKLKFFASKATGGQGPQSLLSVLDKHSVDPADQTLLQKMLTWSVADRITLAKISEHVRPLD